MTKRIIITNGLALFAMFFGAGNIIYPLALGAAASDHIGYVILAFLISGIGLPFLGLYAISLYNGDYWAFFSRLGKVPAFILITFLVLIIGPLTCAPRTETVAFHSAQSFLPTGFNNPYVFSALYCLAIFLLMYRDTKIVDIIGRVLSPIKLALFGILIFAGIFTAENVTTNSTTISSAFLSGMKDGYGTMDLIAACFFCTVIYRSIVIKAKQIGITHQKDIARIFLYSCIIGGVILGLVYVGFMLLALTHASQLQGIDKVEMIAAISNLVLGKYGSAFVAICVSFACLVTAIALTEVTTGFFHEYLFMKKVPRVVCLLISIVMTYAVSILGFSKIMNFALPILEVMYPILIAYSVISIVMKLYSMKKEDRIALREPDPELRIYS